MMSGFAFVVDEDGFVFPDADASAIEAAFHAFTSLLAAEGVAGVATCKWSLIWGMESGGGSDLATVLFEPSEIDRDLCLLVGTSLDRLPNWDEVMEHSPPLDVECDSDELAIAPSLALCGLG